MPHFRTWDNTYYDYHSEADGDTFDFETKLPGPEPGDGIEDPVFNSAMDDVGGTLTNVSDGFLGFLPLNDGSGDIARGSGQSNDNGTQDTTFEFGQSSVTLQNTQLANLSNEDFLF